MSSNRRRRLGTGSYAVLVGAAAIAMLAVTSVLAQFSLNLPPRFNDIAAFILLLSPVLFAVAVILGAIALVRGTPLLSRGDHEMDVDALEIVRRRYARGEIGQEEFRRIREELQLGK